MSFAPLRVGQAHNPSPGAAGFGHQRHFWENSSWIFLLSPLGAPGCSQIQEFCSWHSPGATLWPRGWHSHSLNVTSRDIWINRTVFASPRSLCHSVCSSLQHEKKKNLAPRRCWAHTQKCQRGERSWHWGFCVFQLMHDREWGTAQQEMPSRHQGKFNLGINQDFLSQRVSCPGLGGVSALEGFQSWVWGQGLVPALVVLGGWMGV